MFDFKSKISVQLEVLLYMYGFNKPCPEFKTMMAMEPYPSLSFSIPQFSISGFRIYDNYDSISNTAGASAN